MIIDYKAKTVTQNSMKVTKFEDLSLSLIFEWVKTNVLSCRDFQLIMIYRESYEYESGRKDESKEYQ